MNKSTKIYLKFQLKRKLEHPIKTLFCVFSPVLIFFIIYIISTFLDKNALDGYTRISLLLLSMNSLTYIFIYFVISDLIHEKKTYPKRYILTYDFELISMYLVWFILYFIMILPSIIVIAALTYYLNILPTISFTVILVTLFFVFWNTIVSTMWISVFFKNVCIPTILSIVTNIIVFFIHCFMVYINYEEKIVYEEKFVNEKKFDFDFHFQSSNIITIFSTRNIFYYLARSYIDGNNMDDFNYLNYIELLLMVLINIGIFTILLMFTDFVCLSRQIAKRRKDKKRECFFKEGCLHIIRPYSVQWDKKNRSLFFYLRNLRNKFSIRRRRNIFDDDDDDDHDMLNGNNNTNDNNNDNSIEDESNDRSNENNTNNSNNNIEDESNTESIEEEEEEEEEDHNPLFHDSNVIVETKNIFKTYTFDRNLALNNISLKLHPNEIFAVVGEKNAGKSTLMKILYGHQPPSYSEVMINKKPMNERNWFILSKIISVMPKEDFVFFPDKTVSDHIEFYSSISFHSINGYEVLSRLNFKGQPTDKIKDLDRTDKNKLKIVLALFKNRKILFLEEPTYGMTEPDRLLFWNEVKTIGTNTAIIFSTQSLEEAYNYATTILYLDHGKSICMGDKDFVLTTIKDRYQSCQIEIDINP